MGETESRKRNIVIEGVEENRNEDEKLMVSKVRSVMNKMQREIGEE